nr:hypothetical protein [Natronogracilivirga saccharolytica]
MRLKNFLPGSFGIVMESHQVIGKGLRGPRLITKCLPVVLFRLVEPAHILKRQGIIGSHRTEFRLFGQNVLVAGNCFLETAFCTAHLSQRYSRFQIAWHFFQNGPEAGPGFLIFPAFLVDKCFLNICLMVFRVDFQGNIEQLHGFPEIALVLVDGSDAKCHTGASRIELIGFLIAFERTFKFCLRPVGRSEIEPRLEEIGFPLQRLLPVYHRLLMIPLFVLGHGHQMPGFRLIGPKLLCLAQESGCITIPVLLHQRHAHIVKHRPGSILFLHQRPECLYGFVGIRFLAVQKGDRPLQLQFHLFKSFDL